MNVQLENKCIIDRFRILFQMGNQSCALHYLEPSVSYPQKSEYCIQTKTEDETDHVRPENISDHNQQIDECSPFSKFDINFLKSTTRASVSSRRTIISEGTGNVSHSNDLLLMLEPGIKNSTLIKDWSENGTERKRKSLPEPRVSQKLEAIKVYVELTNSRQSAKSLEFMNMKISGQKFYQLRHEPITPYYQIASKIGQGSFGSVYKGKCLRTGEVRAIKILKKKIMNQKDEKALLSEINILKKMDHISIIKLYDVFEHKSFFYVVTQFCEGGSLLNALENYQIKSEKDVASLMKQIISAVSYMHKMKIAHRDLKLENIVLVKQIDKSAASDEKAFIKIIDFGLASEVKFARNNKTGIVGTIEYMAPELFQGFYSCHSDVWSCGIILCMLLIGHNPFKKTTRNQTIAAIKEGNVDLRKGQWSRISSDAKNLVELMLNKKPEKRINLEEMIQKKWFKKVSSQSSNHKSEVVINNFNKFNRGNNFICYVKNFLISKQLSQDMRQEMALIFQKIDTDGSGVIQKSELIQLYSLVMGVNDQQMESLIDKIDQNKSGRIDFQEFLICMTENSILHNHKHISQAFDYLDRDQTGYIERDELHECLEGCEEQELVKILKDADFNGDGKISREEFINYLGSVSV